MLCEVVAELGPCLNPLTPQPVVGTLPPLPGNDDSDYFHQHLSPPPLLHFLPTAARAKNRPKQFQV